MSASPSVSSPDPQSEQLDRLETLLRMYDEQERDHRVWVGLGGVATGAAVLPLAVVARRGMHEPSLVGNVTLSIGAGALLGGGISLFLGLNCNYGSLAQLASDHRASGKAPEETLRLVEAEWKRRAEEARSLRKLAGGLMLGASALFIGGAALEAFVDDDLVSDQTRFTDSATFLVFGGLSAVGGLSLLFTETDVETAWNTYRLTAPPRSVRVNVGYAPVPAGGTLQLVGMF